MPTDAEDLHDELYSGVHPLEIEEQWHVHGQPNSIYHRDGSLAVDFPYYSFTWTEDRAEKHGGGKNAEQAARAFVERMSVEWAEGPFLQRRLVARTSWETVDA